jgi:hypothetical protein
MNAQVDYSSTTYVSNGYYAGQPESLAFDGDPTTSWSSPDNAYTGYVGQDLGAGHAVAPTSVMIRATRDGYSAHTQRLANALIAGSNDNISWTQLAVLDSLVDTRRAFIVPIIGSAAYRYLRVQTHPSPNSPADGFGAMAELAFSGPTGSGTTERTQTPTSNVAGNSWSVPVACILSNNTPGASIYYTLDGTTPTTASTLYAGPFVIAATCTLKAISASAGRDNSRVYSTLVTISDTFTGTQLPQDRDGNPIYGLNGSITCYQGTYYKLTMACEGGGPKFDFTTQMVVHTSQDLKTWTNRGRVFNPRDPAVIAAAVAAGATSAWYNAACYNRPHLLRNPNNGNWIIVAGAAETQNNGELDAPFFLFVAESTTGPFGPFSPVLFTLPGGNSVHDHAEFFDTDGTPYIDFNPAGGNNRRIYQMSSDFHTVGALIYTNDSTGGEGLALFKSGSVYFEVTSDPSAFYNDGNPFGHKYRTATSLAGPWSAESADLWSADTHAQSAFIFPIPDRPGGFLWIADTFDATDLIDSKQTIQPLHVSGTTLTMQTAATWNLQTEYGNGTPPIAATALSATSSAGGVSLSWSLGSPAQQFVQRSTSSDFSTNLVTFPIVENAINFVDPTPISFTTWFYRILSLTTGGTSTSIPTMATITVMPYTGNGLGIKTNW